jgi:DNA-directed RNA polymerase subunit H (RpoH/RPB5)
MPAKRSNRSKKPEEKAPPNVPMPRHQLVPPHELLSPEDGVKVTERFSTPIERLPKILIDDPGLMTDPKYREAREAKENLVGRIVRVRRQSETAGEAEVYRVIISGDEE